MSLRTLFESGRSLFVPTGSLIIVHGCMVMDSRPWAHPSPAIMSPVRGEYKVNLISVLSGTSWMMVWWVRFSPCCDFTGSLKPLKLSTAGSFFPALKKRKEEKRKGDQRGFSGSVSPDGRCVNGQVTLLIISFAVTRQSKWSKSATWDKNRNWKTVWLLRSPLYFSDRRRNSKMYWKV